MHWNIFRGAILKRWGRQSAFWNCAHTLLVSGYMFKQHFHAADLHHFPLTKVGEYAGFEVFLTTDKNIRYQQNLARHDIAVVV